MEVVGIDCEQPSPIFRKVSIISIVSKVSTDINDKHPWDNLFDFFSYYCTLNIPRRSSLLTGEGQINLRESTSSFT